MAVHLPLDLLATLAEVFGLLGNPAVDIRGGKVPPDDHVVGANGADDPVATVDAHAGLSRRMTSHLVVETCEERRRHRQVKAPKLPAMSEPAFQV